MTPDSIIFKIWRYGNTLRADGVSSTDEPASALLARIRAERDSSTLATKRKSARQP